MAQVSLANNRSVLRIILIKFTSLKFLDTQDYDDTKMLVPGALKQEIIIEIAHTFKSKEKLPLTGPELKTYK